MVTVTDLVHDVIGYLVAQANSAPALAGVAVFDGPTPPGEPLTQPQRLWIGYDAKTGNDEAGGASQTFAYVGNSAGRRREDGTITCTAEAWDGGTSTDALVNVRAQCKAIVGAVEIMLRGYPGTLGPVLGDSSMGGLVQWSEVVGFQWTQSLDANGASAMCVFRITYAAYLNP